MTDRAQLADTPTLLPHEVGLVVSDVAFPVRVLGPGVRVVVWMQGCSIRCRGCMSAHTWSRAGGRSTTVGAVVDRVAGHLAEGVDGITVSGGEPTEQPAALQALLMSLRRLPGAADRDVLVYTGRSLRWCGSAGRLLFDGADAVMTGPYDRHRAGSRPLRGSDNQTLWLRTPLGAGRFASDRLPVRRGVELHRRDGHVLLVGIPGPGDLDAVQDAARSHGLVTQRRT